MASLGGTSWGGAGRLAASCWCRAAAAPRVLQELREAFGIEFNHLFCLNNMPIKRWADFLVKE
jgi:hypothetical protein